MSSMKMRRAVIRALTGTAMSVAALQAAPASAQCISVLGGVVQVSTDLLGSTCASGGQTAPGVNDGIAIGAGSTILGDQGIGLGLGAIVGAPGGISIGGGSASDGADGIAIGTGANVLGQNGLGLGLGAIVTGIDGIALGSGSNAAGFRGIALGVDALSLLEADIAIGRFARAGAPGDPLGSNTAFGDGAVATGGRASSFGANASAVGLDASTFGAGASSTGQGSLALGAGSTATAPGSVAIGSGSQAGAADLIAGTFPATTAGAVAGVAYDNTVGVNAGALSVGAPGATRQIRGVADGTLADDAVNVRQLAGIVDQTNGALNALDVRTTASEGAIAGLDARTTANEGAISGLQGQIATGTVGLVRQDPTTRDLTIGAQTDGTTVNVAGTDGARSLSGVSAATAVDQAVNGGQLAAVVAAFGPGAVLNADGSVTIPPYAVQGQSRTTVSDAIGAVDQGLSTTRDQIAAINRTADGIYVTVNAPGANEAQATGAGSVAIGGNSIASAGNSVAIGSGSVADRGAQTAYQAPGLATAQNSVGEVSVGSDGSERQITHVAAGSAATDAVNVAQLQGSMASTVRYDALPSGAPNYASVTLGNGTAGPVALRNVAPGVAGTDAVNVNQLNGLRFDLNEGFDRYRTEAQRGTAVALAATGMRFDDRPGRTSVGGSVSYFRGETGVAMGIGHTSSNQRLRYNAAVSFSPNGGNNVGAVAGATFTFGD